MTRDRPRSATILGRRYALRWVANLTPPRSRAEGERVLGDCSPPDARGKKIRIALGLGELDEMETLLHEALHAADWSKDEEWVARTSADLARLLLRAGYGRKEPGE